MLIGGAGADALDGGVGAADVASYATATNGVTVDLTDTNNNAGDAAGDSYTGIEQLRGSEHDDVLTAGAGIRNLFGGGGDDTITGTASIDILYGEGGDDTLDGSGGADTLWGGAGADKFVLDTSGTSTDAVRDFQDGMDKVLVDTVAGNETTLAALNLGVRAGGQPDHRSYS